MKGDQNVRVAYFKRKIESLLINGSNDEAAKLIKKIEKIVLDDDNLEFFNWIKRTLLNHSGHLDLLEIYERWILCNNSQFEDEKLIEEIRNLEKNYQNEIISQLKFRPKKVIPDTLPFRNVHLIIDSNYNELFISFVNENFDSKEHIFILITSKQVDIKFINSQKHENLKILYIENDYQQIVDYITNCKKLFIHFLHDLFCEIIAKNEVIGEINWVLWGGDLYNYIDYNLYDPYTKSLLESLGFDMVLGPNKLQVKYVYRKSSLRKISNVLTWNSYDYQLVTKNFITKAIHQHALFYSDSIKFDVLDSLVGNQEIVNLRSRRYEYTFLLGNSGDPSNNHVDILYQLSKLDNRNFRIITPLSYGLKNYIEEIIKVGKSLFGNRFIPLTEFMEYDEYVKILNQVDVAFMNHNRQQGGGNIIALLYLGKKVFMKKENTTFLEFTKVGIDLFEIGELNNNDFRQIISTEKLNPEKNRKIMFEIRNLHETISSIKQYL